MPPRSALLVILLAAPLVQDADHRFNRFKLRQVAGVKIDGIGRAQQGGDRALAVGFIALADRLADGIQIG